MRMPLALDLKHTECRRLDDLLQSGNTVPGRGNDRANHLQAYLFFINLSKRTC